MRLAPHLTPNSLFRFYAPSRTKDSVPHPLVPHIRRTSDGNFTIPPLAELAQCRVIVCTCVSASFAHGVGLPREHFSHVFVDEAGQASEPEVLVGVLGSVGAGQGGSRTNVVLAGDPRQLGPIVRSAVARTFGLEKSLLERLMERDVYDESAASSTLPV